MAKAKRRRELEELLLVASDAAHELGEDWLGVMLRELVENDLSQAVVWGEAMREWTVQYADLVAALAEQVTPQDDAAEVAREYILNNSPDFSYENVLLALGRLSGLGGFRRTRTASNLSMSIQERLHATLAEDIFDHLVDRGTL